MPQTSYILSLIAETAWFSMVGRVERRDESAGALRDYLGACGLASPEIRWVDDWAAAGAVARQLDLDAALWTIEERSRRSALERVAQSELADALNRLSELGYDYVRPDAPDAELSRVASGAALWTASQALVFAVAQKPQNPFLLKLRVFQLGRWPLGFHGGAFVVF